MDIYSLFDEIDVHVKACPDFTLAKAFTRAARALCQESWFLRREVDLTTNPTQPNQQYLLPLPNGEDVIAVKHAEILNINNSWTPLRFPYGTMINPNIGPQQPIACNYIPQNTVQLSPPCDQAYQTRYEVITQPSEGTQIIADELVNQFKRGLGYGALEWLLRMKDEPWTDPDEADKYLVMFNKEIMRARRMAAYDNTPGPRAWIQRGFIRRGSRTRG